MNAEQQQEFRGRLLRLEKDIYDKHPNLQSEITKGSETQAGGSRKRNQPDAPNKNKPATKKKARVSEFPENLMQTEQRILAEIDRALERLEKGSYGQCEQCGREIAHARLESLPHTRHCNECARQLSQTT